MRRSPNEKYLTPLRLACICCVIFIKNVPYNLLNALPVCKYVVPQLVSSHGTVIGGNVAIIKRLVSTLQGAGIPCF